MNFTFVTIPNLGEGSWWLPYLGPVATVIAAAVAGWLAYRLQGVQKAIGESQIEVAKASKDVARMQAEIALDKLKLDLFNRRYDLYAEAQKIAREAMNSYHSRARNPISPERLDRLHEAAFIFSAETANQIKAIQAAAENSDFYLVRRRGMNEGSPQAEAQDKLIFDQLNNLTAAVDKLRETVKYDLSFSHLLPKTSPEPAEESVEGKTEQT